MNKTKYVASAFLSCSLRTEDLPFVDYIARILKAHNIMPAGTVGKYYAAPESPSDSMTNKIADYDFLVVVATPRYLSKDIHNNGKKQSISEQLHAEAGIAKGLNKPIIAFIQEGTNPGNFISQITQYITLDGSIQDYDKKRKLICNLINNTYEKVQELKGDKTIKTIGNVVVGGLAIYGFVTLLGKLFSSD